MDKITKECCERMDYFLKENKVSVGYDSVYREYYLSLKSSSGRQSINYCPWCGAELPDSLRSNWFDILEIEHNIIDTVKNERIIPKEFKSDAWWVKRGL